MHQSRPLLHLLVHKTPEILLYLGQNSSLTQRGHLNARLGCVEVSQTMSILYLSTSNTNSGYRRGDIPLVVSVTGDWSAGPPPMAAAQPTLHPTPTTPPSGDGPTGRWTHVPFFELCPARLNGLRPSHQTIVLGHLPWPWLQGGVNGSLGLLFMGFFELLFVWSLSQDQFAMGDLTRAQKAPDNIAPGTPGTHKPIHHDKVPIDNPS